MADESSALLLSEQSTLTGRTPSSSRSSRSGRSNHSTKHQPFQLSTESTPLLSRRDDDLGDYDGASVLTPPRSPSPSDAFETTKKQGPRWPSLVALSALILAAVVVLCLGFAAPSAVSEYAKEAAVFEPTDLSIHSFTESGVRVRVQGDFVLDASRVSKKPIRDIGKVATWIAGQVETSATEVKVYLPEYGNILLGNASVPPIKVSIRNGQTTHVDILSDLGAGDVAGIRQVANDWLDGRVGQLRVLGITTLHLKSGLLGLGSQTIAETIVFQGQDLPNFPEINVSRLNIHEVTAPGGQDLLRAEVSVSVSNEYPVKFTIPSLGFDVLVSNCAPLDPYIVVANATTSSINIEPRTPVLVKAGGTIRHLSEALTTACPGKQTSPLDVLVSNYIQGNKTTIYIRGGDTPSADTPEWISDLLKSLTIPVPFTGHTFDKLVKNFSMEDTHFSLPDPYAEPDTPEAQPKVSALVKVVVGLPEDMNFAVNISRVRGNVDVVYKGDKLGELDLHKWRPANSSRTTDELTGEPELTVEFAINEAPLQITDGDVFTEVVQALIFQSKGVELEVAAKVDATTETALGAFVVRHIPAGGKVVVNLLGDGGGLESLNPRIESLKLLHTTESSFQLETQLNFTNPTKYSASVPYVDIILVYNDSALAHLTAHNLSVQPGVNSGVRVSALWHPLESGTKGKAAGRDLMSNYISGFNTTVQIKTSENTFPALPQLGGALSALSFNVSIPQFRDPDTPEDEKPRFIKDATMYLWSSTAVFTLLSPLPETTIFITSVDATAFWNKTELVGRIDYDSPFPVPPGISDTPRLPVDLNLGGVGYDALKAALGGTLKLNAKANVGFRVGEYSDQVFYQGKGIGAQVRL